MTKVFIAGSITIKNLDSRFKERLDNIISSKFSVVVGDADGADSAIQEYLAKEGHSLTTVYCSGSTVRNNIGNWPVFFVDTLHTPGSRDFFTAKDIAMADIADFGLMVWDTKSTGTLSNVIALLSQEKKSVVFINKTKIFKNVGSVDALKDLVELMSEVAKRKAESKIKLSSKLESLQVTQHSLFV